MPGWLKALLIVAVISIVFIVGAVVVVGVWIARNKDAWLGQIKESESAGRDFGRQSDNQGCVDEMIRRYKEEPGIKSGISSSIFTQSCLKASRPTPGFCDDVPGEFEFTRSAQWRVDQCRRVDLSSDSVCPSLFKPVQDFCHFGGSDKK
jgi:hypothetical protein